MDTTTKLDAAQIQALDVESPEIKLMQEHKRELLESYERLNDISAHSRSFIWEIDKTGLFTFMSPLIENVLGYNAENVIGSMHFYDILSPDVRNEIKQEAFEIMNAQLKINNYEKKALKIDGTHVWLSTNCKPMYNESGEYIGYRGCDTDITEQRRLLDTLEHAKQQAELSAKAKESFLTNMSHEIRTPLNVIIGMNREIAKETLTENQRMYLKHSEASAYHLLSIINNVLDMSKIEAGEFSLDIKDFSMSALLSNVKSILSSRANSKKIKFTVDSSENISLALKGDSLRLSQVLINLLGNSIKFTDEGFVNLEVKLIDNDAEFQRIRFEISDSGIGMSESFLQNIFQKFTQENISSNRSYEGTGLGMSISKEIVELMGGEIQISSTKGKGTQIFFEIDFPFGIEENLIQIDKVTRSFDISGTRILVVEDNEMNRFIARQSLKQANCIISEAENGAEAIRILQKERFDLILMDIQMPVMDGVEATKKIRLDLQVTTPIIALTANAFKHDIDLYLSIGMDDFLIKPYKEAELYAKIDSFRLAKQKKISTNEQKINEQSNITKNRFQENVLFSLKQLRVIANGDEKFISTMVKMFQSLAQSTIDQLHIALENKDYVAIKRLAHKLKPSLDNLEINILYNEIRMLEHYNEETGCPENLRKTIEFVSETLAQVNKQLQSI